MRFEPADSYGDIRVWRDSVAVCLIRRGDEIANFYQMVSFAELREINDFIEGHDLWKEQCPTTAYGYRCILPTGHAEQHTFQMTKEYAQAQHPNEG